MSLRLTSGDLLASGCDALVNAVNTKGVMGAGLARQFADRYPAMLADYRAQCARGLAPGALHAWRATEAPNVWVLNVATKDHWRDPSRYAWAADGLLALRAWLTAHPEVRSVAVPPLGCGLGGLDWDAVYPMVRAALGDLPQDVVVYTPRGWKP